MTKFQCTKCKYKFEKEKKPARCPYCSKDGTVDEVMDAQELIDEVSSEQESLGRDLG